MTDTTRPQAASRVLVFDPRKVLERRIELGLRQKDVAARAEISPQMLADIEAGRRHGSPPVRHRLAKALNTSIYALSQDEATA